MRPRNPTPPIEITRFDSCDSTNRLLLQAAEAGAPSGTVYVAYEQTSGRGRRGRSWIAEPGCALTFSLLWTFPLSAGGLNGLPLAVGVGIMRALASSPLGALRPGVRFGLKWPNDILLRRVDGSDAKVGGILMESAVRSTPTGGRELAVIIGIGLNALASESLTSTVLDQHVAALSDAFLVSKRLAPDALLPIVLAALGETLVTFGEAGFAALRDEWQGANLWQGEPVRVSEDGQPLLDGTMYGVDGDGTLCILTPSGIERVVTGDVTLRKV